MGVLLDTSYVCACVCVYQDLKRSRVSQGSSLPLAALPRSSCYLPGVLQTEGRYFIPHLGTETGVPEEISHFLKELRKSGMGPRVLILAPSAYFHQKNPPLLILMIYFGICIMYTHELIFYYEIVEVHKKY